MTDPTNHLRKDGCVTVEYEQAGDVLADLTTDEMDQAFWTIYPDTVVIELGDDDARET